MAHKKQKQKDKVVVPVKPKAGPLLSNEAQYFQELVDISNRHAATMKQKAQYQFVLDRLHENRKKIQNGEIKLPVMMTLIPQVMLYPEDDKKKILKFFDGQIESYKATIKSLEGQLEHRYDEYAESAVRCKEFVNRKYDGLSAQVVVPDRKTTKEEENIFEAEFKKLKEDPEIMAEFKKAKKEAIKKNTERAKKVVK